MQENTPEDYTSLHFPALIRTEDIRDISIAGPSLWDSLKIWGFLYKKQILIFLGYKMSK